jgi:hypothetical protein
LLFSFCFVKFIFNINYFFHWYKSFSLLFKQLFKNFTSVCKYIFNCNLFCLDLNDFTRKSFLKLFRKGTSNFVLNLILVNCFFIYCANYEYLFLC